MFLLLRLSGSCNTFVGCGTDIVVFNPATSADCYVLNLVMRVMVVKNIAIAYSFF